MSETQVPNYDDDETQLPEYGEDESAQVPHYDDDDDETQLPEHGEDASAQVPHYDDDDDETQLPEHGEDASAQVPHYDDDDDDETQPPECAECGEDESSKTRIPEDDNDQVNSNDSQPSLLPVFETSSSCLAPHPAMPPSAEDMAPANTAVGDQRHNNNSESRKREVLEMLTGMSDEDVDLLYQMAKRICATRI